MIALEQIEKAKQEAANQTIKCVVWDLDNTVWDGVLLEDSNVELFDDVVAVMEELDNRGILQSIASKNNYDAAMEKLEEFGIDHYFLYPEIHWNPKSSSVRNIAKSLNIGIDTFAFVDDQPFEREEVAFEVPEVLCIDSAEIDTILAMPRMIPRFITPESKLRRTLYQSDIKRNQVEEEFTGNNDVFLSKLGLVFSIKSPSEEDLQRAEELTMRTHQLNTTGYTYSYDELDAFRHSDDHMLFVSTLEDSYGTYGTIGLALVELGESVWTVNLLLMSCRVMSRGVGTIMMSHIMNKAREAGVKLRAHFIPNGRNRMMYVTYKFGGFQEIENKDGLIIFENDLTQIQEFPEYVKVQIAEAVA